LKFLVQAIENKGRDGDTILAHINPVEAAMLKRRGGSGTINPETGIIEFADRGDGGAGSDAGGGQGATGGGGGGAAGGGGSTGSDKGSTSEGPGAGGVGSSPGPSVGANISSSPASGKNPADAAQGIAGPGANQGVTSEAGLPGGIGSIAGPGTGTGFSIGISPLGLLATAVLGPVVGFAVSKIDPFGFDIGIDGISGVDFGEPGAGGSNQSPGTGAGGQGGGDRDLINNIIGEGNTVADATDEEELTGFDKIVADQIAAFDNFSQGIIDKQNQAGAVFGFNEFPQTTLLPALPGFQSLGRGTVAGRPDKEPVDPNIASLIEEILNRPVNN